MSVNTSCDVLKFGIKYGNVMIVGSAVLVSSADDDQSKQYGSIVWAQPSFSTSLSIGVGKLKQNFILRLKNCNTTKLRIIFITFA